MLSASIISLNALMMEAASTSETSVNFYQTTQRISLISLMMEAASTSETLVNFYCTTRRYNPEDSRLHTRRRENLNSYSLVINIPSFDTTWSEYWQRLKKTISKSLRAVIFKQWFTDQ
jgi:hypothetical protein